MRKLHLLFVLAFAVAFGFQSCNDGKTYAEMKEEEADAINKFILENNIKVITEKQFFEQDTVTNENEYVLFDESGVYMHISYCGDGKDHLPDGTYTILSRFIEVAVKTEEGSFVEGDTVLDNRLSAEPEEYKLQISGTSYSASFAEGSLIASSRGVSGNTNSAVPSGWLIPLRYLKPSRTNQADKVARVKIIVPHSEGTYMASSYVYPFYYELTYNLGR